MFNGRISLIIPTKNEARYLEATLAQFAGALQRLDLEIIVSDANSTDDTPAIVARYRAVYGERVKWIQKPGRQNIAIGRNLGASVASGDLLFHLDADVRIPDPERFFVHVREKFADPTLVAATAPLWIYPEESRFDDRFYHLLANSIIRASLTFGLCLAKGECQLVRRAAFEHIGGYNEELVAGEDCNLFYRLRQSGRIAFLHRLVVYHSPRRFRAYGYWRVSLIYLREGLSRLFRRKSYVQEWTPVR